jgi:hypothetical protein
VLTDTIAMTESYRFQAYYSLDSASVVRYVDKTGFDLGFECSASGWRIRLNTAGFMTAGDLGVVEPGLAYDTTGLTMKFDQSDGNPDSTAFGTWFRIDGGDTVSNGHLYAVNCGLDDLGNPLGLFQVIIDSLRGGVYYFRYAPLGGGVVRNGQVAKVSSVHAVWYSLRQHTVHMPEPEKNTFDLLFTQYTTLLYTDEGAPYPYLVTGVLSNPEGVAIATDTTHLFSEISIDQVAGSSFTTAWDGIGYDWKEYDFNAGSYTIVPGVSYLIRTNRNHFYKLRFIGFYDKNGSKGYPVIEFQLL